MSEAAERSLIGAALLAGRVPAGGEMVKPEDFGNAVASRAWGAIRALADAGTVIDETAVASEMGEGSFNYLASLVNEVPTAANSAHYASVVRKSSRHRAYLDALSAALRDMDSPNGADEIAARVSRLLSDTVAGSDAEGPKKLGGLLSQEFIDLQSRRLNGKGAGVPTGFVSLDQTIGGLRPGNVTIIAGGTGSGKSALALCVMLNMAEAGRRCLGFSLEMMASEMAQRAMAAGAGVQLSRLANGRIDESDMAKLGSHLPRLKDLPIWLFDRRVSVEELAGITRVQHMRHGVDVLFVDYLQLVAPDNKKGASREQQVSEISRSLKGLAMEMQIPVVALAQFNRAAGSRSGDDAKPRLSDLRESGAIEQDATHVIGIHKEAHDSPDALLCVLKNRHGPIGEILVRWAGGTTRFYDVPSNSGR